MADIFISYAREDRDRIEKLAAALEGEGFAIWWDDRLQTGASFAKETETILKNAKAVVVAWSAASVNSSWVADEATVGRENGILFPIALDAVEPPIGFRQYQVTNLADWRGDRNARAFQLLISSLKEKIRGATGQAPQTAPSTPAAASVAPKMNFSANPQMIVAAVVFALIAGAAIYFTTRGARAPGENGVEAIAATAPEQRKQTEAPFVAVLPFKFSGSDDGGFLAAGLHDDLLTRLSKLDAFKVISRTSMLEYANTTKNMRQIGEELGAEYILEGGVQAHGERVRINAQLINAPLDEHVWAETFDRELTAKDLFDIQAELAVAIADQMKTALSPKDRAVIDDVPTQNTEAYNAYLRGLKFDEEGGPDGLKWEQSMAAFEEAVRLDPDFGLAWAWIAFLQTRRVYGAYGSGLNIEEDKNKALDAIAKARALAPDLLEAELAWIAYVYRGLGDYEKALDLTRALESRYPSSAQLPQMKSFLLRRLGRFSDAYAAALEADRLSPRNLRIMTGLIDMALSAGNCAAAAEHVRFGLEAWPKDQSIALAAANYEMGCTGDLDRADKLNRTIETNDFDALEQARRIAQMRHDFPRYLEVSKLRSSGGWPLNEAFRLLNESYALSLLGQTEDFNEAMTKMDAEIETASKREEIYKSPSYAQLYAWRCALNGDAPETLRWLKEWEKRFSNSEVANDRWFVANNHFYDALTLATTGLNKEAIAELRTMLEEPGGFSFIYVDPWPQFDGLRNDPGYAELRERFGPKS